MNIEVKKPTEEELISLGVKSWPIWEKEASSFDWYYDQKETCYFLEGEVEVETEGAKSLKIQKGDLVVFPKGLNCKWQIQKAVRKHYKFE
ncbi:MAG: cupin domain-containing protein [Candidatus Omnitrophica bacterium]|nr:cupin domain-containing protein [Candidatus Omnitrophota bacterium]MBU2043760.1 cupin domain-containing protein [Candidatus Omnitrophota bacterium]MBU2265582.1 cupin domain-containing protein [Candidatus Omnitrophota bacterium]MBU2473144.1 cupin domain-containing protein [Candidatus Omnitrophota bacterium]